MKQQSNWYVVVGTIICSTLAILLLDRWLIQRAKFRNQGGKCAKCQENITSDSLKIAVGGGKGSTVQAFVCRKCYRRNVWLERIVFAALAAFFLVIVLSL